MDFGGTSPLFYLAKTCRYPFSVTFEVIEKAILLLRFGADITYLDEQTNNILHCILQATPDDRLIGRETQAETLMTAICNCGRCNAKFWNPRQLLEAAVSKGANIYAINEFGKTPTMIAEKYNRDKEWAKALEACGIDVNEVMLHKKAWESVLDELDDEYQDCSPDEKAKVAEGFNSSFWNSGHLHQKSSLSFEEFCKQRDRRRRLIVNCDYEDYISNFRHMMNRLFGSEDDYYSDKEWSEEQNEESSENSQENLEGAASHVNDELRIAPNESFNYVTESHNHDGVLSTVDDLVLPVESDDVADSGNVDGNNRDVDMANTYWEDPFYVGASGVGTPVMSFGEFMNLDVPDAYSDEPFRLGASRVGEPLIEIDEI
jgi:hypothetical protein